jgi:pyruvate/2-oxoglutarate dehydrogenase complex dihydrolipoamide acyltransferase (E2) component
MPREFRLGLPPETRVDVMKRLVQPGDSFERDVDLVEINTDKVAMAVPATFRGRVIQVLVAAGKSVDGDAVLAILDEA